MAQAQVDTRNLEWKDNNVGSKLLQKMGWKDGEGIGKRRLRKAESSVSSEGLRVRKRADGLGLGASSDATAAHSAISHASDFSDVLQRLQKEHGPTASSAKAGKGGTTAAVVSLPTNKSTHARVRQAKFQQKTAEDMKCIFAGADVFASIAAQAAPPSKKRLREERGGEKAAKKKKKDRKKEGKSKKASK